MVEFTALSAVNLEGYRPLRARGALGTLGLITINADVFLCVIGGSTSVATVRPGENVQRIDSVEFCQSSYLSMPTLMAMDAI